MPAALSYAQKAIRSVQYYRLLVTDPEIEVCRVWVCEDRFPIASLSRQEPVLLLQVHVSGLVVLQVI